MKVEKNMVVSLAYQVRTSDGVLVDEALVEAPLDYLHGFGSLISGLEKALEGRNIGDKFDVEIGADEGYGKYNEALVQRVPKDVFMGVESLEVGMRFIADTDQGPVPVEITEIDGDEVVVDGNHILAGQDLKFHVEVLAIREATEEELHHGHAHAGQGGCCGGHDHGGCGCSHDDEDDGCCGGHGHDNDDDECCGGHGHHGDDGCCGRHHH